MLLRALGYTDEGFLERFVRHFDFLEGQWEKERELAPTQEEALLEIYKRARPGEPPSTESARAYFENAFFNPKRYDLTRVGRYKLDRKLGPGDRQGRGPVRHRPGASPSRARACCRAAEILAACSYLLHLAKGEPGYRLDDQDHFANRRIRSVGELIQNQVRVGLSRMERVVRERMTTQDVEAITPQTLINIRPVVAAIKEFFGTSQLSQFMDQTNPLSGLTHKRRLSAMGPGGLSRERAGFEVRDVHTSHYGRMCPIETPEGPNIGLIGHLASYGRINSYGFIETPYRKVVDGRVTDEITYLAADEEEEYVIAQANAKLADDGTLVEDRVLVRRAPLGPGVRVGAGGHQLRHHQRGRLRAARRGGPDGRLAEADRVDLDRPDPLHRARRRQPGPHGRQHAEAGGARWSGPRRRSSAPASRPAPPATPATCCWPRATGMVVEVSGEHVTVDYDARPDRPARHRRSAARSTGWPSSAGPTRTPASTSASSSTRAPRWSRATCWPTAPPPRPASWASARTSWWPSCPGRATTTRTPSSSPSAWCATTCSPRSTSRSTRSTPATPSSAPRRSPGTSPTCPRRSSRTSTSGASSASAPRSAPATCWSARSPPRARPS